MPYGAMNQGNAGLSDALYQQQAQRNAGRRGMLMQQGQNLGEIGPESDQGPMPGAMQMMQALKAQQGGGEPVAPDSGLQASAMPGFGLGQNLVNPGTGAGGLGGQFAQGAANNPQRAALIQALMSRFGGGQ